jgi:hypothetical protein
MKRSLWNYPEASARGDRHLMEWIHPGSLRQAISFVGAQGGTSMKIAAVKLDFAKQVSNACCRCARPNRPAGTVRNQVVSFFANSYHAWSVWEPAAGLTIGFTGSVRLVRRYRYALCSCGMCGAERLCSLKVLAYLTHRNSSVVRNGISRRQSATNLLDEYRFVTFSLPPLYSE